MQTEECGTKRWNIMGIWHGILIELKNRYTELQAIF